VALEHHPELEEIMKSHTDQDEREKQVTKWFNGKMGLLKEEVARVNGEGWVHGDLLGNAGNVRWDKDGKPVLIDWGNARKRVKAGEKGSDKAETDPPIIEATWRSLVDAHVKEWADNKQKGTEQATSTPC
jgi:tRNA A-37 threonylcarbamoyl transferase component Bud32